MTTTAVIKHKRGFFGWIWLSMFWLFQAFIILLISINVVSWFAWFVGTMILGILVLATRGKYVMVTK